MERNIFGFLKGCSRIDKDVKNTFFLDIKRYQLCERIHLYEIEFITCFLNKMIYFRKW